MTTLNHDHSAIAHLEGYQPLRKAIDDLIGQIRALPAEAFPDGFTTEDFGAALVEMASTSYAADDCERCHRATRRPPVWPHTAVVQGREMRASYRCPTCDRSWGCSWEADQSKMPDFG
jgi:hypothetical protein